MPDVDRAPDQATIPDPRESVRDEKTGVPAGVHRDADQTGGDDAESATEGADVPDPIPEADSAETEEAWEESESMGGEAPTG